MTFFPSGPQGANPSSRATELPPWGYRILAFLPLVAVFILSLAHPLDPDLGWHLKYGEYIAQRHTLPAGNTFSAEMPGYPYINHAWGSDLILYTVFHEFGFAGISVLSAIIVTAAFACFARVGRLSFWEESLLFPPLIYLLFPIIEQSFRSQLASLLGMGALFLLLEQAEQRSIRWLGLILPLFFCWANIHGQFIVGLGLYACWSGVYLLRTLRECRGKRTPFPNSTLLIVVATGIGAGLVSLLTPHGMAIYTEIGHHAGTELQQHVNEWQPIRLESRLWRPYLGWGCVLAISTAFLYRQRQLLARAHYLIPAWLLFFAAFQQRRHFWPMVLLSVPVIAPLIGRLRPRQTAAAFVLSLAVIGGEYLYGGAVNLPRQHIFAYSWDLYCRHLGCTPQSAEFLQQNLTGQALLTDYDLGGWLIWNYPTIKPTIDGRMPFWRDERGYSAYEAYLSLENGTADIDQSPYTMVYWSNRKEALFNRLSRLAEEGKWRLIYTDPFASIFVRNQARQ